MPGMPIPPVVQRHAVSILTQLESFLRWTMATRTSGLQLPEGGDLATWQASLKPAALFEVIGMCSTGEGEGALLSKLCCGFGPGSNEQRQLYSLLCTLLKLRHMEEQLQAGIPALTAALKDLHLKLAYLAAELLHCSSELHSQPGAAVESGSSSANAGAGAPHTSSPAHCGTTAGFSAEQPSGAPSSSAARPARHRATAASSYSPIRQLPSLALLGRCCLQWAKELEAEALAMQGGGPTQQVSNSSTAPADEHHHVGHPLPALFANCWNAIHAVQHSVGSALGFKQSSQAAVNPEQLQSGINQMLTPPYLQCISRVQAWLLNPDITSQLSAAGYSPQLLVQQGEALLAAQRAAKCNPTTASVTDLADELRTMVWLSPPLPHALLATTRAVPMSASPQS